MFNGTCSKCGVFKPRCATVTFIPFAKGVTLCDICRKVYKGTYRLHDKHKVAKK